MRRNFVRRPPGSAPGAPKAYQAKSGGVYLNAVQRVIVDAQTMASGTLSYAFFPATPGTTQPINYQRNALPYSLTVVYGIRFSLNVNSITPAQCTELANSQITLFKNQVNIFSSDLGTLLRFGYNSNFSATNTFVVWRDDPYILKETLEFTDTEPFQLTVTFAAQTSTNILRCHLYAMTYDKLVKKAN